MQRTDGPIPNVTAVIEVTPPTTTPLLSPYHTGVTLPMATAVGHFYHLCDGNNRRKLRGPNLALKTPGGVTMLLHPRKAQEGKAGPGL